MKTAVYCLGLGGDGTDKDLSNDCQKVPLRGHVTSRKPILVPRLYLLRIKIYLFVLVNLYKEIWFAVHI